MTVAAKKEDWQKEDEVYRAIVLADSFNEMFLPISLETPRAMVPLLNIPMVDYTIEALISSEITEILVLVCAHADQLKEHISRKKYADVNIRFLTTKHGYCMTFGDAMREIDRNYKDMLNNHFLLCSAFVVCSFGIKKLIQKHKEHYMNDKNCALTVLMKKQNIFHKSSSLENTCISLLHPESSKLLYLSRFRSSYTSIPLAYLKNHKAVVLHSDYHICDVFICSPVIPHLFTDNFDFQNMHDLIVAILNHKQFTMPYTIAYQMIPSNGYIDSVSDISLYFRISMDIIERWSFPLVPEKFGFKLYRNSIYLANDFNAGMKGMSYAIEKSLIGKEVTIGNNCEIECCVFGNNCKVEDGSKLKSCILWNNVAIGSNCVIKDCLMGDNVSIGRNSKIGNGCILSYNVKIPEGTILPKGTYCTTLKAEASTPFFQNETGETVYKFHINEELRRHYDWGDSRQRFDKIVYMSQVNELSDDDEVSEQDVQDYDDYYFRKEVTDSISNGFSKNSPIDAICLEISASKHAYNVPLEDVLPTVIDATLKVIFCVGLDDLGPDEVQANYSKNKMMAIRMFKYYTKSEQLKLDALSSVEEFFSKQIRQNKRVCLKKAYLSFMHDCYDNDVFEEDIILRWHEATSTGEESEDLENRKFRSACIGQFLEWLQDAEEESSEE